jgi:hypothetical protein
MRARGQDIVELFGFAADDTSPQSVAHFQQSACPFVGTRCGKTNHDGSLVYGTCSVTTGKAKQEIIICPKRMYADNYRVLLDAAHSVWPGITLVAGGTVSDMEARTRQHNECAVALGQNSGREVTINANGKLSLDWVIQRYKRSGSAMVAQDYIGIEVQSIDITGNYRDNWKAYSDMRSGVKINSVPDSGHGMNWANVHKRLIPQIIRKGNVYAATDRCLGFFFILPDLVYEKFEGVLGNIPAQPAPSKDRLSVLTYVFDKTQVPGQSRRLNLHRTKHHSLADIAFAFTTHSDAGTSKALDEFLKYVL